MTGIDWQGAARKGQLTEVLYLLACRLAWRRHGDQRARDELVRASECGNAEIREIAANILKSFTEITHSGTAYEQQASPQQVRRKTRGA